MDILMDKVSMLLRTFLFRTILNSDYQVLVDYRTVVWPTVILLYENCPERLHYSGQNFK